MRHESTLTYTNADDGVWLRCSCGHEMNLGFGATLQEAVGKQDEHVKVARKKNRMPAAKFWAGVRGGPTGVQGVKGPTGKPILSTEELGRGK